MVVGDETEALEGHGRASSDFESYLDADRLLSQVVDKTSQ